MTIDIQIRTRVLVAHGALTLGLGLAFLYLRAIMTNLLFEVIAVSIAMLLSAAALILAAIADWFAAFSEGIKHVYQLTFYVLAGFAFVLTGFFIGYYPQVKMEWLIWFAAVHALAFGISALAFAIGVKRHPLEQRFMYLFGTLSVLFSGLMFGLDRDLNNRAATGLLGAYLCFVGTKMLFFAWSARRIPSVAEGLLATAGDHGRISPAGSLPASISKY